MIVESADSPRPLSKVTQHWARRIENRNAIKDARRADNQDFDNAIKEAMLDSGATSNFIQSADGFELIGPSSKTVSTANGQLMRATMTALLPLTQLRAGAREAIVIPELKQALMSVKQLADQGYTTIFHPHLEGVTVHDNDGFKLVISKPPLLQGWREKGGLWTVPLAEEKAFNIYELPSTKEVIRFGHAALGFPTKPTLLEAIRNKNLVTFPGMSAENVNKFFPDSDETQKGHMKQSRQGVRSTKVIDEDAMLEAETHPKPIPGVKLKDVYLRVFDTTKKAMYTDQPGRFPITSAGGHKYTMVAVELDGNYIDAEPMKNKTEGSIIKAYLALWARLTASGTVRPKTHLLDNEASAAFKAEIKKNCTLQLVPPDNHRRNLAERAIQTFKSHFKAILAGVTGRQFSNESVGQIITTDHTYTEPLTTIQRRTDGIGLPIC